MSQEYDIEILRDKDGKPLVRRVEATLSESMTRDELREANKDWFAKMERMLGKEIAEELFEAYLDGIDKATKLSQSNP